MTVEFTYTEADFVNAFGSVSRSGSSVTYNELLNTSVTRMGKRVAQTQVNGGETFEFYLEANKAGLPGFTHAKYSSNPTFNTTIDPSMPEHIKQPQQTAAQAAANIWYLRWEDKNTADPGFDADFNDVVVVVRVNGDRDGDGLWDDWETNGIDMDGDGNVDLALNAPPFNADPDHKDVYLELDYMKAADHDHKPLVDPGCNFATAPTSAACGNTTVARLIQAFANAPGGGIRLHVDTGPGTPFDLSNGDPLGGGTAIPEVTQVLRPIDGPLAGANNDFYDLKAVAFSGAGARRFIFHYGILAHEFSNCAAFDSTNTVCTAATTALNCATGNAEGGPDGANDFIVALSTSCSAANATPSVLLPKQIGSIMHELGHTLGLGHGGRPGNVWDDTGYKPNYPSVMNYDYQLTGLGTTVSGAVYTGGTFDYSRAALIDLPEGNLLESAGVGPALWNPDLQVIYWDTTSGSAVQHIARGGGGSTGTCRAPSKRRPSRRSTSTATRSRRRCSAARTTGGTWSTRSRAAPAWRTGIATSRHLRAWSCRSRACSRTRSARSRSATASTMTATASSTRASTRTATGSPTASTPAPRARARTPGCPS